MILVILLLDRSKPLLILLVPSIQRQTPLIRGTHILIGLELELLEVLKAGVLLLEEAVVSELMLGVIPVEEFVQKYRLLL